MIRNKFWQTPVMLLLAFGLLAALAPPSSYAADKKAEPLPPLKLKVGDTAPNFTLLQFTGHDLKKVSLSDFRGKKDVVLAFYVFAFTGG